MLCQVTVAGSMRRAIWATSLAYPPVPTIRSRLLMSEETFDRTAYEIEIAFRHVRPARQAQPARGDILSRGCGRNAGLMNAHAVQRMENRPGFNPLRCQVTPESISLALRARQRRHHPVGVNRRRSLAMKEQRQMG